VGHEKWSKDLGFENFGGIASSLSFELVTQIHARVKNLIIFGLDQGFHPLFEIQYSLY